MNTGNIEYIRLEELSNVDYKIVDGEADVTGWPVKDEAGRNLGKVRDLLFDPGQNAIRYLIVELEDVVSGTEDKAVLIPIGFAEVANDEKAVVLPVMHDSQFVELPQYIIGEVTRETELKIRQAIGSPAALRIEEEIVEIDNSDFYHHHHFDRRNVVKAKSSFSDENAISAGTPEDRREEVNTIHELIDHSHINSENKQQVESPKVANLDEFEIRNEHGVFTVEPQDNGTYRIIENGEKVGVIYGESVDEVVQWRTMDHLDERFVNEIGQAITTHNQ